MLGLETCVAASRVLALAKGYPGLPIEFPPTRTAALQALSAFVPKAGKDYASGRNYDLAGHPHVSTLSPYIRHRLITEQEVLQAVLGRFSLSSAQKFVQEVFWRTYWKGWLEMRPQVWVDYQRGVQGALNHVQTESGLRDRWEAACKGETDIDCFNHWAQQLVNTGYMHNHARMWFASIWIFTLRLPWELGADFFMRHLLDGDPASNTLSWRWVAGLQTKGKTYLARPDNIAKYTEGRFQPTGLATDAPPLSGPAHPTPMAAPVLDPWTMTDATGILLTEEDLSPGFMLQSKRPVASAVMVAVTGRSPLSVSPHVTKFTQAAAQDTVSRHADKIGDTATLTDVAALVDWARSHNLDQIVTAYAPVGPAADTLTEAVSVFAKENITLTRALRPYDATCWPHATHGFFKFKDKIPKLVGTMKGVGVA
ncbi:FAD-binding domain-containing protein [Parasulfitobacter algicola]|uniref:DNA photolyase n=1 Tax=Parasulfitobacter algicola TaxID=2614809 RepID=A0ABX2IRM8_9RHOB|nr:FAD-binding domain-containing protein [Sulfitobacter algicola]NSX55557.1 DNA photolyase [Sulfitobacter algicola]